MSTTETPHASIGAATSGTDPFSARLRTATRDDHASAEGDRFLTRLLDGSLDLDGLRHLVVQHLAIYTALEGHQELASDPVVGPFLDPALRRAASLHADAAWLREHTGPVPEVVLPATQRYVARLHACASEPQRFLAHHYTRYLGDLSGGRHIGRVLERRFGGGTSFSRFDGIDDPRAYKAAYRERLDALDLDEQGFVDEVRAAYGLNREVFADLDALTACTGIAARWHGAATEPVGPGHTA